MPNNTVFFINNINNELILDESKSYTVIINDLTPNKITLAVTVVNEANVKLFICDLAKQDIDLNLQISFKQELSKIYLYQAVIVNKEFKKNYQIHAYHDVKNTVSDLHIYGVARDKAHLNVTCKSEIVEGSFNSQAHQEIRLTLLDNTASASSDPILIIDENDIAASHANAIGMLDKEQIFYLQSRGLTYNNACKLIIDGFFAPILENITDENVKQQLQHTIEGMN